MQLQIFSKIVLPVPKVAFLLIQKLHIHCAKNLVWKGRDESGVWADRHMVRLAANAVKHSGHTVCGPQTMGVSWCLRLTVLFQSQTPSGVHRVPSVGLPKVAPSTLSFLSNPRLRSPKFPHPASQLASHKPFSSW